MIFMFSRGFSMIFTGCHGGKTPTGPWRLGQARQVVESAVAFNLPGVEATVDEMQALAKNGGNVGKNKGKLTWTWWKYRENGMIYGKMMIFNGFWMETMLILIGFEGKHELKMRSNLREFSNMCSPDCHPFLWATSRFVWCSCNSYCWRVRRGKTKTDISRCKRGYQPGGRNCWRLSTFNSVLQIQKTYRPSLSRLNSQQNKNLPHVRVNIFKPSNEHRKSNRYNNYSYKSSIKLNKSCQTQDISLCPMILVP